MNDFEGRGVYRQPDAPPDDRIPRGGVVVGGGWLHPVPHACAPPGFWTRLLKWIRPGRRWTCGVCFVTWKFVALAPSTWPRWEKVVPQSVDQADRVD